MLNKKEHLLDGINRKPQPQIKVKWQIGTQLREIGLIRSQIELLLNLWTQKGHFQGEGKGLLNVPPSDPPQVGLNDNFSDIFCHL